MPAPALKPMTSDELHLVTPFDLPEDQHVPWVKDLIARAFAWAATGTEQDVSERTQANSVEEVLETPTAPVPKRVARRRTLVVRNS